MPDRPSTPHARRPGGWILACVLVAIGLTGCGDAEPGIPVSEREGPEQITYDYHTTQSQGGTPTWELWGESAMRYAGEARRELEVVRMVFYRDGEQDAVLTSERGEINEETQATVARGNVVVVSEDGRTLESEVLYWDPERQLIHTDAFVRFTDGDQVLTGYGMETDPDLTNLVILRQVKGEIYTESESEGEG